MRKLNFKKQLKSTANCVLLLIVAVSFALGITLLCSASKSEAVATPTAALLTAPTVATVERGAAPTDNSDETVYVTRTGKKYHRKECRWASKATPMKLGLAAKKYEPCSVCVPPRLAEVKPSVPPELPAVALAPSAPAPKPQEPREFMPPADVQPIVPRVHVEETPAVDEEEAQPEAKPEPKPEPRREPEHKSAQESTRRQTISRQSPCYYPPQNNSRSWPGLRVRGRR